VTDKTTSVLDLGLTEERAEGFPEKQVSAGSLGLTAIDPAETLPRPDFSVSGNTPNEAKPLTFFQGVGKQDEEGNFRTPGEFLSVLKDDSIILGAGGVIVEQNVRLANNELFEANRQSKVYERWQKPIWAAEDALDALEKNDPEYQVKWEELQTLQRNRNDDLKGRVSS